MERLYIKMELNIKDSLIKILNTDKEIFIIKMEIFIKAVGTKDYNTEKVQFLLRDKKLKENGIKEIKSIDLIFNY